MLVYRFTTLHDVACSNQGNIGTGRDNMGYVTESDSMDGVVTSAGSIQVQHLVDFRSYKTYQNYTRSHMTILYITISRIVLSWHILLVEPSHLSTEQRLNYRSLQHPTPAAHRSTRPGVRMSCKL